jgi:hypothetical protein
VYVCVYVCVCMCVRLRECYYINLGRSENLWISEIVFEKA